MINIVFLDQATVDASMRAPDFPHQWINYPGTLPEQVVPRLKNAQVAITNKVAITRAMLDTLPELQLIVVAATGYNQIDIEACRERNITVCNVPAYSTDGVAEHALLLILALRRHLPYYLTAMQHNEWEKSALFFLKGPQLQDIKGSTLAIIGHGSIAERLIELMQGFNMEIVLAERKNATTVRPGYTAFTEALQRADIVSLHAPLTADTRNMIGRAELALMKPNALLINTGRGGLIDEAALLDALTQHKIAGAALDVVDGGEPPQPGNPILQAHLPNLIITPHIAWSSKQAVTQLSTQVIDNIEAFIAGKPQNVVS